jgi:hypothetical protein
LFLTGLLGPALPTPLVSEQEWQPALGDRFVVDTRENEGYLLHTDGTFLRFPVATGQKKVVHYRGETYNAATPLGEWIVRQRTTFGDRFTYGKTGRFFRLYADLGSRSTSYGIHSYAEVDKWFREDERYKTMGCIVVSEGILTIIEETYHANGDQLYVATMQSIEGQGEWIAKNERGM